MATITENNPQKLQAMLWLKVSMDEAEASGRGGRIIFPEDLPFFAGRFSDWNPPVVSYRESLAKVGKTP